MNRDSSFARLLKAAHTEQPLPADFEHRVMIGVARRAIERSRRRARRALVASLAGLTMLLAGCLAALVAWFPTSLPASTRGSWLEWLRRIPWPEWLGGSAASVVGESTSLPFFEQWGGLVSMVLLICGAAGFIYYLNGLFSSDRSLD